MTNRFFALLLSFLFVTIFTSCLKDIEVAPSSGFYAEYTVSIKDDETNGTTTSAFASFKATGNGCILFCDYYKSESENIKFNGNELKSGRTHSVKLTDEIQEGEFFFRVNGEVFLNKVPYINRIAATSNNYEIRSGNIGIISWEGAPLAEGEMVCIEGNCITRVGAQSINLPGTDTLTSPITKSVRFERRFNGTLSSGEKGSMNVKYFSKSFNIKYLP